MFCKAEVNLPIMGYWPCLLVIYAGIGAGVRQKKKKKNTKEVLAKETSL
jgi:prolipoprotein diacylglyceryltransferase